MKKFTVKELKNILDQFDDDLEVRHEQIIPMPIMGVDIRDIDVYKCGKCVGKKKAVVIW
ncbi:hypothetical protein 10S11_51 [uncultured Caudovirales phage]|uniref:Uncharacterized protein n=1 Tax=uncultured Caudovirales phage TaxID=2100421 RepID=A0A2H4J348_9CAUD|nr:hypothetical protein 10S11_51 [uncultured Caudovirales phage]